jgi:hypothetical protein
MATLSDTSATGALSPSLSLTGVAVCTTGEARGHSVWADDAFLRELVRQGNAAPHGVKARYGHPPHGQDAIGTELGRFRRWRLVNRPALSAQWGYPVWQAVADLEFVPTAANQAGIQHVLALAASDPRLMGASVEFLPGTPRAGTPTANNPRGLPLETLVQLLAVAITSDPASNPDGLLAQ